MPQRDEWIQKIRAIERQAALAYAGLDYYSRIAKSNPMIVPENLQVRDIKLTLNSIKQTYFIRIFAEFESGLRDYYASIRSTEPPTSI